MLNNFNSYGRQKNVGNQHEIDAEKYNIENIIIQYIIDRMKAFMINPIEAELLSKKAVSSCVLFEFKFKLFEIEFYIIIFINIIFFNINFMLITKVSVNHAT